MVAPTVTRCLERGQPLTTLVKVLEELSHDPNWSESDISELRIRVLDAFFDRPPLERSERSME